MLRICALLATVAIVLTGCGPSAEEKGAWTQATESWVQSHQGAELTTTTTAKANTTVEPTAPRIPTLTSGIVVQTATGNNSVAVGYIDPVSGRYEQFAQFAGSSVNDGARSPAEEAVSYAPDYLRHATTIGVGQNVAHAGWIDQNGKITDVNSDTATPGPFGGNPKRFDAIGFNGAGYFYYSDDDGTIFELAPAASKGAKPIATLEQVGSLGGFIRGPDGKLTKALCLSDGLGGWLSPDEYIYTQNGDEQINRASLNVDPDGIQGCASHGTPLLPATNTSSVANAVLSPDRTQVAFQREDSEIWIVDVTGHGQPHRVPLEDLDPSAQRTTLLGWK